MTIHQSQRLSHEVFAKREYDKKALAQPIRKNTSNFMIKAALLQHAVSSVIALTERFRLRNRKTFR